MSEDNDDDENDDYWPRVGVLVAIAVVWSVFFLVLM